MGYTREQVESWNLSREQIASLGLEDFLRGRATDKPRKPGRRAHTPGVMNRTEARYAREVLMPRKLAGQIEDFAFEPETLQLGPEMTFTPDFRVIEADGTRTYIDVKGGHVWEDSIVKAKAAAVLYPEHRFEQARWVRGRKVRGKWIEAHWKSRVFRAK